MNELPEGTRGRVLAVALLLTVLAAGWAGVAAPLLDWYAAREVQIAQRARLAVRMEQVAAELPALRERAGRAETAAPVAVLQGGTDSIAGAALQQLLQRIGADAGVQLSSAEVLPGEQVGAYRRIGIRLSMTGEWPEIVRVLTAIAEGTPKLFVNELQVQGARALIGDAPPALSTSLVVFGFRAGTAP